MNENLAIWSSLEKTDPKFVKPITGKQYRGSSPNPTWVAKRLTEVFGPNGHGWRIEILDERLIEGAPVGEPQAPEVVHQVVIRLHTKIGDEWGWSDHTGQTTMRAWRMPKYDKPGRWDLDEDAPKKSVTDAMTKAASLLGVAGDIFLGRWDDSKYQAELAAEARDEAKRANGNGKADPLARYKAPAHDAETGEIAPPPFNAEAFAKQKAREIAGAADEDELALAMTGDGWAELPERWAAELRQRAKIRRGQFEAGAAA